MTSDTRRPGRRAAVPPPEWPPMDREEARRLYEDEGLTVREVAQRLGYAYNSVLRALRDEGVAPHPPASRGGKRVNGLYRRWCAMRSRCRRPGDPAFAAYGGRGIGICKAWESYPAFEAWALSSGWREGVDLVLIRRDRPFSPGNCRWQPRTETARQAVRERMKRAPLLRGFGEEKTLGQWASDRRCRVPRRVLWERLRFGHSLEAALTVPKGRIQGIRKARPPLRQARPKEQPRIDWSEVERAWRESGETYAQVAKRLGVTRNRVQRHLRGIAQAERERKRLVPPQQQDVLRTAWRQMHYKCSRPSHPQYERIGGQGIGVCREWERFEPFLAWSVANGWRAGLWLTRRDRLGDFTPANCAWKERLEILRESSPDYVPGAPRRQWHITAFGETRSLNAWVSDPRCAVSATTLRKRLVQRWDPERALREPRTVQGNAPSRLVEAFGERKGINAWGRDPRCQVNAQGLRARLLRGVPDQQAVATPPFRLKPGGSASAVSAKRRAARPRRAAHRGAPIPRPAARRSPRDRS